MRASTLERRSTGRRLLVLLILLVAFGLRCARLDYQELRGDEAFGYFFSLPTLGTIAAQTLDLHEPHPVASYWLQHLWLGIAGHSEFALRYGGVWWSVLAVALMAPLATFLGIPANSGNVAMALMALSPYTVWHAQDARMYSMSLALTLASTVLALRWWASRERRVQLVALAAYVVVTWLALHTHYFALYVVAAQHLGFAGWSMAGRAWRKLVIWWGAALVLLLLWMPWLLAAWSILLDYGGNGDSPALVNALVRAHSAFVMGETVPRAAQPWWAAVALVVILLGVMALWQREAQGARAAAWFLVVYWLTPLAATWISALSRPIFNERYLVAGAPPVYLLMAAAWMNSPGEVRQHWTLWLRRGMVSVVAVAMVLGLVRHYTDPLYSKTRGWRELAMALDTLSAGADPARVRLVQNYPDPTLWYYYQGDVAHLVLPPAPLDARRSNEEVAALAVAGVQRIVLVEQPTAAWDPGEIAKDALATAYANVGSTTVANWPVSVWLRALNELAAIDIAYEGGLQLAGASVTPEQVQPGSILEVYLRWMGGAGSVVEHEAVSLQLLNTSGELVAQTDRALAMASVTTAEVVSYGILVPTTLAEGVYDLMIVVYDTGRAGAPRRLTQQGSNMVRLATVQVTQ